MHAETEISNGVIRAKAYLPDSQNGYYRGTRFDWSGVISSLEYEGHQYFGPWFECHNPLKHDGIVGPAEEFQSEAGGLGYAEASAGGTFIRIGVGVVRKPDESAYRRFGTYEVVDPGKWEIAQQRDCIEFTHEAMHEASYAYVYRKTIRLERNRPRLLLQHTLKNAGTRPIESSHYNHNFFVIDGQPAGPDFSIEFPFEVRPAGDLKGLAEVRGRQIVYTRELQKGQSILTGLEGFGGSAGDHRITVENRKTGAGVRISGDQPLADLIFWSIRTTVCPEPYVFISVEPGKECSWESVYEFYSFPPA
jgi:hypothetical protein